MTVAPFTQNQSDRTATMCADTTTPDYRPTVFLPETEFPMRAGLPQREPDWLARWLAASDATAASTT